MKIITVLALYALLFTETKGRGEGIFLLSMLALSLALAMGLEVPYVSEVLERLMGGVL